MYRLGPKKPALATHLSWYTVSAAELAGQVVQAVLIPGIKYWLAAQQTKLAPFGEQNLVPDPHVPAQVVTWASNRRSLSIVKYVSDVPVVLVTISLKYDMATASGIV
jgi:hypothetical protein